MSNEDYFFFKTSKHLDFCKHYQLRKNTALLTPELVSQALLRRYSCAGYILTPVLTEQPCYLFTYQLRADKDLIPWSQRLRNKG